MSENRHPHWRVSVETSGETIVSIETEMLAGREISEADEDAIRTAAHNLLAFIGDPPSPQALSVGDGEASIIECLAAGEPFVFDPATNFLHADDGTVEGGIRYAPVELVVGAPFITKEWFERRANAEADLEIGAGFSVVTPTDADIAQMEVLAERALPQWAQDELARLRAALSAVEGSEG